MLLGDLDSRLGPPGSGHALLERDLRPRPAQAQGEETPQADRRRRVQDPARAESGRSPIRAAPGARAADEDASDRAHRAGPRPVHGLRLRPALPHPLHLRRPLRSRVPRGARHCRLELRRPGSRLHARRAIHRASPAPST